LIGELVGVKVNEKSVGLFEGAAVGEKDEVVKNGSKVGIGEGLIVSESCRSLYSSKKEAWIILFFSLKSVE